MVFLPTILLYTIPIIYQYILNHYDKANGSVILKVINGVIVITL